MSVFLFFTLKKNVTLRLIFDICVIILTNVGTYTHGKIIVTPTESNYSFIKVLKTAIILNSATLYMIPIVHLSRIADATFELSSSRIASFGHNSLALF